MRSQTTPKLTDVAAKGYALLRKWEDLAPLDSEQLAVVDLITKHSHTRPLPVHLSAKPSVDDETPSLSETATGEEDGAVLHTGQAFYQWHAKLEALRVSEAEQKYNDYASALGSQLKTCQDASQLIHDTLSALNRTLVLYRDAVGRSRSMRETGERLVAEQEQLSAFAAAIRERLHHFEELESIAAEFHSVASSLDTADLQTQSASIFARFLSVLHRLDECITYVHSNPQCELLFKGGGVEGVACRYSESASYESRFRQLHGRALGGILHRVREILRSAVKELTPTPTSPTKAMTEAEETNNYYVKFRALVEQQLQSVFVELAKRSTRLEYKKPYEDCQLAFCNARSSLLTDLVKKRIDNMRGGQLDSLLRDGFSYLVDVCRSEHQLFLHFFPEESETPAALMAMMNSLGTVLYDEVRPRLIASQSLDDLCDCVSILQTEIVEGQIEGVGQSVDALRSVVVRSLADAQERLIYKAQGFVAEKIARHELSDANAVPDPAAPSADPDGDGDAVSNSDRDAWYGPLRATVEVLEKLYDALEPPVFGGIAHDAISACSQSIAKALTVVSKAKGAVDGQLFAIRHLLILREELIRFQMEFSHTEKDLDFAHMRDHMRRVLSGEVSVFQLPARNVAQLVSWTAPRVTDTQIDSKKRLEKQLKESCEALIMTVTKATVEPMLAFLTKASALRGDASLETRPLSDHAFASVERLEEIVENVNATLEASLPELVQKMRQYLPQDSTFATLYRPIKANVIDAHVQIASILERDYNEADIERVPLRSRDELISIMDDL